MALLQIHEPGQTPMPHEDEDSVAIGIDLGTTHSLVAISKDHKAEVISDENGVVLLPSAVSYHENKVEVGYKALQQSYALKSVKRLMGKGVDDIAKISGQLPYHIKEGEEGMVKLLVQDQHVVTPVEVSAEILRALKAQAEAHLKKEISKAVITVPAYFDESARMATKHAAQLAGLDVLRLISEPTAAALAYGLDQNKEGIYAVYDLGGGTFDVSILQLEKGIFRVLATGGDTSLGGDDFDRELVELFMWEYKNRSNTIPTLSPERVQELLGVAKAAKETLSDEDEVVMRYEQLDCEMSISRDMFEKAITPFVDKTVGIITSVLEDAGLDASDIDDVILVGGATRVPLIQSQVAACFSKDAKYSIDPDQVVALGAALQAEQLTGNSKSLLLDVLPLSLGMETMGGIVEKVIYRNTPIPVAKSQEFTTYQDGQTAMTFHVVQGEREMASQNRSLAHFKLSGIPPQTAGAGRVKVTFVVDADGLLTVTAEETVTGAKTHVEVKPSYGLSDEEVIAMLKSSMEHGKEDMEVRLLAEARVEADRVILALEGAIDEDQDLLEPQEADIFAGGINELRDAMRSDDRDRINQLAERLEHSAETFVQRRMNTHIGEVLKGKHIDDSRFC